MKTLEIYIQEVAALTLVPSLPPAVQARLRRLAAASRASLDEAIAELRGCFV